VPGFDYTTDRKDLGITWNAATLNKYLTNGEFELRAWA